MSGSKSLGAGLDRVQGPYVSLSRRFGLVLSVIGAPPWALVELMDDSLE